MGRMAIIICLALSGSRTAVAQDRALKLDSSKIRSWNANAKLPCRAPFLVKYKDEKSGRQFAFLAVDHLQGPTRPQDIPAVAAEINAFRPDSLVVEMDSDGRSFSKSSVSKLGESCLKDGMFTCGEGAYGAVIGDRVGAKITDGEPSEKQLDEGLSKMYGSDDRMALSSAKTLIMMKYDGIPQEEWKSRFQQRLSYSRDNIPSDWTYERFEAWLKKNKNSSAQEIRSSWIEPRTDASSTRLQKIAAGMEKTREPRILGAVSDQIARNEKTMMIYGTAHYYKQAPAFEKAFGKPIITCLDSKPSTNSTGETPKTSK